MCFLLVLKMLITYLVTLKLDKLLVDWLNNYTNDGNWRYDGFWAFEQKMLHQTPLDLGLVDDLSSLTINECRDYLTKLDIIFNGTKIDNL